MAGNNRIMIFGPKSDGTYVVEFRTAAGETFAMLIVVVDGEPMIMSAVLPRPEHDASTLGGTATGGWVWSVREWGRVVACQLQWAERF